MSFKYTPNTLKKIEGVFEEAGYIVRFEKGNFNSGYCILEDKKVVVVNKFFNTEGRINALVEILPSIKFDPESMSAEIIKFYHQLTDPQKFNDREAEQGKLDLEQ